MDDSRIRQLTDEVFAQLQKGPAPSDLEDRLAALETAVARLSAALPGAAPPHSHAHPPDPVAQIAQVVAAHPALRLLEALSCGEDTCVLEPEKACCHSGRCKTFGH
jgi:hypothetical protein